MYAFSYSVIIRTHMGPPSQISANASRYWMIVSCTNASNFRHQNQDGTHYTMQHRSFYLLPLWELWKSWFLFKILGCLHIISSILLLHFLPFETLELLLRLGKQIVVFSNHLFCLAWFMSLCAPGHSFVFIDSFSHLLENHLPLVPLLSNCLSLITFWLLMFFIFEFWNAQF